MGEPDDRVAGIGMSVQDLQELLKEAHEKFGEKVKEVDELENVNNALEEQVRGECRGESVPPTLRPNRLGLRGGASRLALAASVDATSKNHCLRPSLVPSRSTLALLDGGEGLPQQFLCGIPDGLRCEGG